MQHPTRKKKGFGTAPVFFTAISTILGAILFLRFGYAVGLLGFVGVTLIIFIGHLVTIPTALALSEIATNQKVEGGGEYFIISRSFGLNIGATIGISLFFSQAISVAFYVIAFTEAFEPLFNWVKNQYDVTLPRQVISIPAMLLLGLLMLSRGASMGVKTLYIVVAILFISLILFFIGTTGYAETYDKNPLLAGIRQPSQFFIVFAIVFPAFTGMTAGVGLSGDLKNPSKSIPLGTITATLSGMVIYFFIAWKLHVSASAEDLINNQLMMSNIAVAGNIFIPLGLAASTISSAIGSIMVAPRTLQALGVDRSFPFPRFNYIIAKGKGSANEPFNATLLTTVIALVFVALGSVDAVASIISMFFMVTYGSICLISFLYHFGADLSYRPSFRSRWYLSLIGFLMCVFLMFMINTGYAILAIILIITIYLYVSNYHKDRQGMEVIFQGAMFQLSRRLHVYLQKSKKKSLSNWRPSAICISSSTFERYNALELLNWISYRYGFGTYIHLINGYLSKVTQNQAQETLKKIIESTEKEDNVYIDTLISPSYTSAIAQIIQLPSISGMENNMVIFEFNKKDIESTKQIIENFSLVNAATYDCVVLGSSHKKILYKNGIHVWLRNTDYENANLMILLGYIILGHPVWKRGVIKIFDICSDDKLENCRSELLELIQKGRLPISPNNIEIIKLDENISIKSLINQKSADAGLVVTGFRGEQLKHSGTEVFSNYDGVGNIIFVNANKEKDIV
ncbi:MAG: amino acid permease [Bacteroidales bacterium]